MHYVCTAAASTHCKILPFTEAQLQQTEQLMTDLGASDICVSLVHLSLSLDYTLVFNLN